MPSKVQSDLPMHATGIAPRPVRMFAAITAVVLAVFSALTTPSNGQTWPQQSVKFIVPLGPGSGADIAVRLFADRLAARWGKPVVVENRPGGDGFVGIAAFVGAGEEHTFLFTPSAAFTAHPFQHDKLPYDPRDLVPIARVSNTLIAVGVPASLNVGSLAEMAALARAQPGKLNWAGTTGATDFVFAGFMQGNGLDISKVAYRDGVLALNDLAEGRIQVYAAALAIVRPQVEAGKVRVIAITNHERAPTMPDVPTVSEAGYPALTFDGLVGLFGPQSMPSELRSRIAADIQAVARDADIVRLLGATGQLVRPGNSDEFAAAIAEQRATVAAAAKGLGIKSSQ
jgi:tripartite-type tricarboxylate transporter receptor subunit TctC